MIILSSILGVAMIIFYDWIGRNGGTWTKLEVFNSRIMDNLSLLIIILGFAYAKILRILKPRENS